MTEVTEMTEHKDNKEEKGIIIETNNNIVIPFKEWTKKEPKPLPSKKEIDKIVQALIKHSQFPVDNAVLNPQIPRQFQPTMIEVWNRVVRFLKDNAELTDDRLYHVLTGWVFANYIPQHWEVYPYLYMYGLYKSGKTRLMNTLALISLESISASNMSSAFLFRLLSEGWHTLFIDEYSPLTKDGSELERDTNHILNAGYKKGGNVGRCVGKKHTPKLFPVYGFKSIGSIYMIPDALRSRCVMINMVKSKRRFPIHIDKDEAETIQGLLKAWHIYAFQHKPIPTFNSLTVERLLFDICQDGRLVEIFFPIYTVAPISIKPIILDYLKKVAEEEKQEELASFECDIFKAFLEVVENNPLMGWVSIKEISDAYNNPRDAREQIKTRTVSRHIKRFGFKPFRTATVKGYKVDLKLIDKLKQRYQIQFPQPKQKPTKQSKITP